MALLEVETSFHIDLQFETAPFHLRFFAWCIDLLLMLLFAWGMLRLLDRSFHLEEASEFGLTEIFLIFPFLMYHLVFELWWKGQSPGKKIFRIQVLGLDGKNPTASQCMLRWLLRLVDFGMWWGLLLLLNGATFLGVLLCLAQAASFILFIVTRYNQRVGDVLAGTTVVMRRLDYQLRDTLFQDVDREHYSVQFPQVMRLSDKDLNILDHLLRQHRQTDMSGYIHTVASKIQSVLQIETNLDDIHFLETLLTDYNYLSQR